MNTKLIFVLLTFLFLGSCSTLTSRKDSNSNASTWTKSKRLQHLKNIQDSATWDYEILEVDKQMIGYDAGPFELGAFPVPDYDILGEKSFRGLGNKVGEFSINNKKLVMNSFFVKENELNKNRLKGKKDEVFFQIIVLADTLDAENHPLKGGIVLSRNHPDYLGQGFVTTKNNRIDYLAFQTAEEEAFAIVNTRLFNLDHGNTILIAPQKDRTLKSLQLKFPGLTAESILEETNNLINREEVIDFFDSGSSI